MSAIIHYIYNISKLNLLFQLFFLAYNILGITADAAPSVNYNYQGGGLTSYVPKPTYAHSYCDGPISPLCVNNSTNNYCVDDPEYPEYEIKGAITADYLFAKKYADVVMRQVIYKRLSP